MKKLTTIGVSAFAVALALAGCSSAPEPEEGTEPAAAAATAPEGLIDSSTVTFCIDPEYPPLEYYENGTDGEIIGFDADAARAIAAHWGLEATFEVTTFEGLQPGLQTARCDIIPGGLYMSEARLEILDGVQYMQTGPALIVRADDDTEYASNDDLCGLTISAQSGSSNAAIGDERRRDIVGFPEPTWDSVVARRAAFTEWTGARLRLDSMLSQQDNVAAVLAHIASTKMRDSSSGRAF